MTFYGFLLAMLPSYFRGLRGQRGGVHGEAALRPESGRRRRGLWYTRFSRPGGRDRCGGGLRLLLHRGRARPAPGAVQIRGSRFLLLQPGGCRVRQEAILRSAILFALVKDSAIYLAGGGGLWPTKTSTRSSPVEGSSTTSG